MTVVFVACTYLTVFPVHCGEMLQMLFCVGNFFGNDDTEWQQVISGTIKGRQCL